MTGIKAGIRSADGNFETGSINQRVEQKLREFAERGRAFTRRSGSDDAEGENGKAAS